VNRMRRTILGILLLQLALAGYSAAADRDPGYRFSTSWFTSNIPKWEEHLGHLRGRPGLAYLEIGPYEGQSFFWVVDNLLTDPSSSATAIDIFAKGTSTHYGEDYEATFRANLARSGASERINVITGRSQIELRGLPVESFDLIYIDGSHASRDVLTDLVLSWDLLAQGGFLVLDDYRWGAGKKWPMHLRPQFSIDAFISAYAKEIEVVHRGYQVILRKQPDRCLQVHYEGCSYIGPYYYDWRKRQLLDPKTLKPTPLRPEQKQLIETILRSTVTGHPLPVVLDPKLRGDERFIELNEQLGLGL
jgi:predicted O-methyltransferase YrrM